jgi:hypothetical protein
VRALLSFALRQTRAPEALDLAETNLREARRPR